jgi:hydrogenase maturation factor
MLPVGKLPPHLLQKILAQAPVHDPRVLVRPGLGLDCAVVDLGSTLLVIKSDPITFATEDIGWYLVQINANDIATTGATPRWMLINALLPEGKTAEDTAEQIAKQAFEACQELGIDVIGGHTEITAGLDRPILMGTLIGEVLRERLVLPTGARPGDAVLLTKGVPIEATALLAREFHRRLALTLSPEELEAARRFLTDPGISVVRDARLAVSAGRVTAMHDPTEGGVSTALWELAEACGHSIILQPEAVPVPALSAKICQQLRLDPLGAIASGALLITATADDSLQICNALQETGIDCQVIGQVATVRSGYQPEVLVEEDGRLRPWPRPDRDEIARLFEGINHDRFEN